MSVNFLLNPFREEGKGIKGGGGEKGPVRNLLRYKKGGAWRQGRADGLLLLQGRVGRGGVGGGGWGGGGGSPSRGRRGNRPKVHTVE